MMNIRPITTADNGEIAKIIREVLTEFGANKPGFAWQDPELDFMAEAYYKRGRAYWVVESGGRILGGGGIAEFNCQEPKVCELQKMYLLSETRGLGLGAKLIDKLVIVAGEMGYRSCYLETLSSMSGAIALYKKKGFMRLSNPMGDSGHSACDEWYSKTLY